MSKRERKVKYTQQLNLYTNTLLNNNQAHQEILCNKLSHVPSGDFKGQSSVMGSV